MPIATEYSPNNSGGSFWLKDEEWKSLEEHGWYVEWLKDDQYSSGLLARWLGTLAKKAWYPGNEKMAIASFETYTSQFASDEGCNCCGEPHSFREQVISQEEYDKMFPGQKITW